MRAPLVLGLLVALAALAAPGRAVAQTAAPVAPERADAEMDDGVAGRLAFDTPLGAGPVVRVPVDGMIDNALASYVARAVADAEAAGAAVVVFDVDTFGGLVDAADLIRTTILDTALPTVALIDKDAASAGALISLAADRIAMVPGASIGAATVVDGAGTYASEKMQSYMRSLMRATAEANGRDPRLAEAMVDERIVIPGVVDSTQLLSLSAQEALRLGIADAVVPSYDALAAALGVADGRDVVAHRATTAERVLRFLGSPAVASLLLLMLMGGLYFELQTPGVGFAGAMALVGGALFFAPHYLLGLVESWEIALFALGVALLLAEVFVVPGFGLPGIAGLVLIVGSLAAALIPNVGFQFPTDGQVARAFVTLAVTLVLLVVLAVSLGRYLPQSRRFSALVLAPELSAAEGYTAADTDDALVGQTGRAITPLRPAGTVAIGERRVDVVTQGDYVEAGAAVEVVGARGSRVEVRPLPQLAAGEGAA